jgi:hypothetical protein
MESSVKRVLSALAVSLGLTGTAHAAPVTFQAVFSDIHHDHNGALAALGAPGATEMIATWTIDTEDPFHMARSFDHAGFTMDYRFGPYEHFEMSIGPVTLVGVESVTTGDRVFVRDGVADGLVGTHDQVQIGSFTDRAGPDGTTILDTFVSFYDHDESLFSGLAHPTLDEMNMFSRQMARISLTTTDGEFAFVQARSAVVTQISPVPLPAGATLMLTGMAGFWVMRRRKRTASAT